MEIQPKKPSRKGPAEMFTGEVWLDPITAPQPPASFSISAVHFSPGARTAWHHHSHGQVLHVTDGEGLIQSRGDAIHPIGAGDTIHTPADEWHWHGATPDHTMTHLTITEGQATWGEHVTDAEYHGDVAG
jgi:quercetin dioxygenase-like cupin family protein